MLLLYMYTLYFLLIKQNLIIMNYLVLQPIGALYIYR